MFVVSLIAAKFTWNLLLIKGNKETSFHSINLTPLEKYWLLSLFWDNGLLLWCFRRINFRQADCEKVRIFKFSSARGSRARWQRFQCWKRIGWDSSDSEKLRIILNMQANYPFWSPFLSGFLFWVNFTKNWSCDQILVIFTKNWSCDQFQSSSWPNFGHFYQKFAMRPNFGNFYQKLVTRPIPVVISTKFWWFLPNIGHMTNSNCHRDQTLVIFTKNWSCGQLQLTPWPNFDKNYQNFW